MKLIVLLAGKLNQFTLRTFFLTGFIIILTATAHAASSKDRAIHELSHFIMDKDDTSVEKILDELGEPDRRVKKLGGWEYWHYHSIKYEGVQIGKTDLADWGMDSIVLRHNQYVSPREYARLKHPFLNIIFFPVLLMTALPLSSVLVLFILLFGLYGIVKLNGKVRILCGYLVIGCVLAFAGIIF